MAFITYNLRVDKTVGIFDTREEAETLAASLGNFDVDDMLVVEMDYDRDTTYLHALKLASDGVSLENPHAGKTIEEQATAVYNEDRASMATKLKASKTEAIKLRAKSLLNDRKWRMERAKDQDLINGNNNAASAESAIRNSIRTKSGEVEDALNALTAYDDIASFDVKFSI